MSFHRIFQANVFLWSSVNSSHPHQTHMHNIMLSLLQWETLSRGQWEKGIAMLARELTCHSIATCCSGTKNPLGEPRQKEKPGREWVSSSSTEKRTLVYPPWPLCHPWILFTPQEVFSLIDPPRSLFFASHSRHIHGGPSSPLCSASSFSFLFIG